jgi:hypothetical protein
MISEIQINRWKKINSRAGDETQQRDKDSEGKKFFGNE